MASTDQPFAAATQAPAPSANGQTADPALRADAPAPLATPKRIVAFSDGTGNSSGKLFRTNVYRLYDALDLGSRDKGLTQIAYYDNGVGTSNFKPLALLGGIFGIGLKRNLLNLYLYVCRNYNPGDQIFAFGFSRGAFTVRLLVALICTQGIVPYEDERELQRNGGDALRRFLSANEPDLFPWLFRTVRWLRDGHIRTWRALWKQQFDVAVEFYPEVEFVGVWDTVSAYGGPVVELTRAIDQYLWPLTMTDFALHPKVKMARHALALDDERDSFWPLLWDEVAESRAAARASSSLVPVTDKAEIAKAAKDSEWLPQDLVRAGTRLKQVWFSGMHSDVGGSYPDDSLAYVSLKWMIDEIGDRLAFIPSEANRIRAFANPLGPMHDSRKGMASYYRYQPRKIAAMLHTSASDTLTLRQTLILRDPIIGEEKFRPQGLLLGCRIHASVLERISVGNDNYAPIVLPRDFAIEPAPTSGEQAEAAASLAETGNAEARGERQENAWDFVWRRRLGYFVLVFLTSVLVFLTTVLVVLPLLGGTHMLELVSRLDRLVQPVIEWVGARVHQDYQHWYSAIAPYLPPATVVLLIFLLNSQMSGQEAKLRDTMRRVWWTPLDGTALTTQAPTPLRAIRNSLPYQAGLQFLKWRLLPGLLGWGALLAIPFWLLPRPWCWGVLLVPPIVWIVRLPRRTPQQAAPAPPPPDS